MTGMHRSTATRRAKPKPTPRDPAPVVPINKLTAAQCARVLAELNSARFVDRAPLQVWAALLDEGTYLCSVSETASINPPKPTEQETPATAA